MNITNNKTFDMYGYNCLWIDNPEKMGLRFAGTAQKLGGRAVNHSGWFLDCEMQHEAVYGVVYQLTARSGKPRYLYGYESNDNPGSICLSMDIIEGKSGEYENESFLINIACRADKMAEKVAEKENEWKEAYTAGQDCCEQIENTKVEFKKWIAEITIFKELWKARRHLSRKTIKNSVSNVRETLAVYKYSHKKSQDFKEYHSHFFKAGADPRLKEAWDEGLNL